MSAHEPCEEHVLVNGWLRELGLRTGLSLRLDADGVCGIGHASGLDCAVEVPTGRGVAFLRIPLMPWVGAPAGLAEHCLGEHFMGLNTAGAAFGIDREAGELVLWTARRLGGMDEERFGHLLIEFFETAALWKAQLDEFCRGVGADTDAPSAAEPSFARA